MMMASGSVRVCETATEAGVYADVNEATSWSYNSPSFPEDGGIVSYVGVNHDGNHTRERGIREW